MLFIIWYLILKLRKKMYWSNNNYCGVSVSCSFIVPAMLLRILSLFILSSFLLLLVSCDRPECQNYNKVFDQYTPDREEYKLELAKEVKGKEGKLRYWLDKYQEKRGQ